MTPGAGAVVVTGAARGIGAAIATRFAADGYTVIGVDRDGDGLKEVMTELPGAQAVVGDVTDEAVMEAACERGAAHGLVALVANAGIARPGRSLDYPREAWDQILAVDLTAAFLGARAADPSGQLLRRCHGPGRSAAQRRTHFGVAVTAVP